MDILRQTKLSQSEWESIEIPIPESEMKIINMIYNGYGKENINTIVNYSLNMIRFTKIHPNAEIHAFLYEKYFHPIISENLKSLQQDWKPFSSFSYDAKKVKNLKKADSIRIENANHLIQHNIHNIYEFDCMTLCNTILEKSKKNKSFVIELYTILEWRKATIEHTNPYVLHMMDLVIAYGKSKVSISNIILNAYPCIEKNPNLYKYENLSLFPHQKELFALCEQSKPDNQMYFTPKPKLILYTAPTGTGKTLSPIGLSKQYKIIFVCVARHVGLALAKSAISIHKRVAFAFGCNSISDIKLHYFSAVDYTRDRKSGGIWKVDHSNGEKVEIMICDVHSYLYAMRYMMAFNPDTSSILTYWDEPTMTLDYESHPLHDCIKKNWCENAIYNMVLSCATLPNESEIQECIQDFRVHFNQFFMEMNSSSNIPNRNEPPTVEVHTITSYDCRKTIPIINPDGFCFMPHIHCDSLEQLHSYSNYCNQNKTLLRYFDLEEIIQFIQYIHEQKLIGNNNRYHMEQWFESVESITMNSLKLYYLALLRNLTEESWNLSRRYLQLRQTKKYFTTSTTTMDGKPLQRMQSVPISATPTAIHTNNTNIVRLNSENHVQELKRQDSLSGVLLTTKDAYTLTDGPTIYLADNILNMAKFYVKESKIPDLLMKQLIDGIVKNEKILEKIQELEQSLKEQLQCKDNSDKQEDSSSKKGGSGGKSSKTTFKEKDGTNSKTVEILENQIDNLRSQLFHMSLNAHYIPNSEQHQEKWTNTKHPNAFRSSLSENDVKSIMELEISLQYKVLVLMGVGVLIQQEKKEYEEIVKLLAEEQKLFLILTSSDYIYGTNYQFCHGFIGKDLQNMTPQKTLQAMGRVGRNKHQQNYTIRFRDDNMIRNLFKTPEINREAYNMNLLFSHD
jgi:hypothetical protein